MFIQQQTLTPQKHADELAFLNEVISLWGRRDFDAAATLCMERYCALQEDAAPTLGLYDPRAEARLEVHAS
jgi:hypothetical protein